MVKKTIKKLFILMNTFKMALYGRGINVAIFFKKQLIMQVIIL